MSDEQRIDSQVAVFQELLGKRVALDPDLEACRTQSAMGWEMIAHPLVHDVFYTPLMNAMYNEQLHGKRDRVQAALDAEDWHGFVFLHERPYRAEVLWSCEADIEDYEVYGELVRAVWMDSENIWQHIEMWEDLLTGFEDIRGVTMMDDDEKTALDAMPDILTVYRGYTYELGWSWTLDAHKARWFAVRFAGQDGVPAAKVAKGKVHKELIVAYLTGRGEEEIVVNPDYVHIERETLVK